EQGRRRLDQYTRYGTIGLSIFQSFGIAKLAESISAGESGGAVIHPGIGFQIMTVITLTTGTAFLMWIGEQITERGVSNGISLLSFPATLAQLHVPGGDYLNAFANRGGWVFNTGYTLLIIFFCYFYTNVTFQPVDVAENLKKQQANIPGIRPGKQTADYIYRV